MSFILDALRKSEIERQRDSAPTLVRTPQATVRRETPFWIWLLIVLLSLALAGLVGAFWLRGRSEPAVGDALADTVQPTAVPAASVAPRPAAAATANTAANPSASAAAGAGTGTLPVAAEPRPFVDILRVDPGLPLYSLSFLEYNGTDAARSSAWINGRRYFRGQLVDGRLDLVEIRPDGVVLAYQGQNYLLTP
jgi:hypothetical protein